MAKWSNDFGNYGNSTNHLLVLSSSILDQPFPGNSEASNWGAITKFLAKVQIFEFVVGVKMQTTQHYCPPPRSYGLNKSNCFLLFAWIKFGGSLEETEYTVIITGPNIQ